MTNYTKLKESYKNRLMKDFLNGFEISLQEDLKESSLEKESLKKETIVESNVEKATKGFTKFKDEIKNKETSQTTKLDNIPLISKAIATNGLGVSVYDIKTGLEESILTSLDENYLPIKYDYSNIDIAKEPTAYFEHNDTKYFLEDFDMINEDTKTAEVPAIKEENEEEQKEEIIQQQESDLQQVVNEIQNNNELDEVNKNILLNFSNEAQNLLNQAKEENNTLEEDLTLKSKFSLALLVATLITGLCHDISSNKNSTTLAERITKSIEQGTVMNLKNNIIKKIKNKKIKNKIENSNVSFDFDGKKLIYYADDNEGNYITNKNA